jgi:hypothetical protein
MFHIIDLEACSAKVQRYADLDGLVPAPGDRWQDFHWTHRRIHAFADRTEGDQCWHDFLLHAEAETIRALHNLEDLKWSNFK